jgi:hypothetical protein
MPMPTVSRPSLRKSRLASEFASASGLVYCGPTSTLVPRPTVSVAAAANASDINGSHRCGAGYD